MIIYLQDKISPIGFAYKILKKTNLFSKIFKLENNTLKLITKVPIYEDDKNSSKRMAAYFRIIMSISDIQFTFYPITREKISLAGKKFKRISGASTNKILHIFFDIDSTLTPKGVSTVDWNVRSIFDKFNEQGCNLYFCTGRSYQEVIDLTESYEFGHPYGIAENGGIIVGIGGARHPHEYGHSNEPLKLVQYMLSKNIRFKEDKKQKARKTEFVIDLKSISENALKSAIKASGVRVEYHKSKRAYHIMEEKVNKGTAIGYLLSKELKLNPDVCKIVGMGDSGLDIKMFESCEEGYIPADADKKIRKFVKKKFWLKEVAPKAVGELYNKLFPV